MNPSNQRQSAGRRKAERTRAVIETVEPRRLLSISSPDVLLASQAQEASSAVHSNATANTVKAAVKAPGAPINLVATAVSYSQLTISWSTPDSLATGYLIERSLAGTSAFTQVGNVTAKRFADSGLAVNTSYVYRVTAYDSTGSSAASATVTGTTKNKAPAIPTSLAGSAVSSTQINLTWSTSDSLATSFIVQRSTTGSTYTTIATVTAKGYSDTALTANTKYYYEVIASNAAGNSLASSRVLVTTKVPAPGSPVNVVATVSSTTQIKLTWSAADSFATGYIVEQSVGGAAFMQVATTTSKSYTASSLAPGTAYSYRVTAYDATGSSAPSATATAVTKSTGVTLPAAPTALTATPVTISQINLTWATIDSLAAGFTIQRSVNGGAFVQIAQVTAKSYNDTGLAEGTTYSYRVLAYNTGGSSAASTPATATTLQRPASPTNLAATATGISQINLAWTAADSLATGYLVERSGNGSAFTQIANVTIAGFNDTGLAEGATYTYRVTAYNAAGSSAASTTVTATTLKRPAAPTGIIATATSISQINLSWATSDQLATGFVIERSANGSVFSQIATVASTSYADTSLLEGTTYTYRVTAYDAAGSSLASATAIATTLQRPGTPTSLSATPASVSEIDLTWTPADALATSYLIERSSSDGAFAQVATVATASYADTGLVEGATYTYRVTAFNAAGSSSPSPTAIATTSQRPGVPTGLAANAISVSQINLSWTASDSLATGYVVERASTDGVFAQIATVATTSFSDTGLAEGGTYTYRVTAYDLAGSSSPSATATASTLQRPAAPSSLTATAASISQINLAWTASDALATGFIVERAAVDGVFTQIADVATTTFNDTGLAEGAAYTYRVTAYNVAGSSAVSATTSAFTLQRPNAPIAVAATAASISQINLTWTASDGLAAGFIVERASTDGVFAEVADVKTTSFGDTGLAEGATYTYRVTAYNAGGLSAASDTATATTSQRPGAPTALTATAASISQINLAWTAPDALATGYLVERAGADGTFVQIADVATNSYADTGLAEGSTYTYRVTAYDFGGSSTPGNTATATTLQRSGTPTALIATPASISQINLTWSPADSLATDFVIERAGADGVFAQIADVATANFSDTGLAEGATYTYRVTAQDAGGSSSPSSAATATTLQRPATPAALTATPASISQINVAWTATDGLATGYIVERSDNGGAFAEVADIASTGFSDTGLIEGATYAYRVTAYDAAGSSAATTPVTTATLQRPGAPTNLTATTVSISQINLSWTAAGAPAKDYVIERSTDGTIYSQLADVSSTSYSDAGLIEGVTYLYRITARNSGGSAPTSSVFVATTYRRPATPTGLTATIASLTQVNLKWTAADTLATGFTVERSISGGAYSTIATVTGTSYNNTGLTAGTTYAYRVTAYNAGGSVAGATVTTAIKTPGAPTSVVAAPATTSSINVTWKAADTLAADYLVERSADGGVTFTQVADVTKASYSDTNLSSGSAFTYRVTAHNALGSSSVSTTTTATVPYPPAAATALSAMTANANEIDLTWTAGDAITTGYIIERSSDNGATFTQVASVAGTNYADTGLVGSTAYTYRVTATDAYGSATPSGTATAATLLAPSGPTSLTANAISQTEVDLTWTPSTASPLGYFVERSTNFGAFVKIADLPAGDTPPTTYKDTGLTQNTIYTYRVSAYGALGYGASPTAQATTLITAPPAPPAVRPSAATTGVAAGITLTTLSAFKPLSNTTYSNLYITGQMTLTNLTNIKFVNCVIDAAGATYDIRCDGATNITIQNCVLKNATAAGIYGDGYNATANDVYQIGGDAFKAGNNVLIYGNFVTDLGYITVGAHSDGVQVAGSSHVVIVGNFFDTPIDQPNTESNSPLFVQLVSRDVVFASNWVLGGNYAVHAFADGGGDPTIDILNNIFYAGTTRYGFGSIGVGVIWQRNVTDSGAAASPTGK